MFNDINLSKDLMNDFKATASSKNIAASGVDFSAEVLTNGHWPEQAQAACSLPQEMKDLTFKFE